MSTYTLDAQMPDGTYREDHGLTAEEVANARINAPRLGITILNVAEEIEPMSEPEMIRAFGGDA